MGQDLSTSPLNALFCQWPGNRTCSGCKMVIYGLYADCAQCNLGSLCGRCVLNGVHPEHYLTVNCGTNGPVVKVAELPCVDEKPKLIVSNSVPMFEKHDMKCWTCKAPIIGPRIMCLRRTCSTNYCCLCLINGNINCIGDNHKLMVVRRPDPSVTAFRFICLPNDDPTDDDSLDTSDVYKWEKPEPTSSDEDDHSDCETVILDDVAAVGVDDDQPATDFDEDSPNGTDVDAVRQEHRCFFCKNLIKYVYYTCLECSDEVDMCSGCFYASHIHPEHALTAVSVDETYYDIEPTNCTVVGCGSNLSMLPFEMVRGRRNDYPAEWGCQLGCCTTCDLQLCAPCLEKHVVESSERHVVYMCSQLASKKRSNNNRMPLKRAQPRVEIPVQQRGRRKLAEIVTLIQQDKRLSGLMVKLFDRSLMALKELLNWDPTDNDDVLRLALAQSRLDLGEAIYRLFGKYPYQL